MTALSTLLCKSEYEAKIAASRDERMKWWREARYGMFIHYGCFRSVVLTSGHGLWKIAVRKNMRR